MNTNENAQGFRTVGMGAVVIRDVPAHTVVAGCPARPLTSGSLATTIKG